MAILRPERSTAERRTRVAGRGSRVAGRGSRVAGYHCATVLSPPGLATAGQVAVGSRIQDHILNVISDCAWLVNSDLAARRALRAGMRRDRAQRTRRARGARARRRAARPPPLPRSARCPRTRSAGGLRARVQTSDVVPADPLDDRELKLRTRPLDLSPRARSAGPTRHQPHRSAHAALRGTSSELTSNRGRRGAPRGRRPRAWVRGCRSGGLAVGMSDRCRHNA